MIDTHRAKSFTKQERNFYQYKKSERKYSKPINNITWVDSSTFVPMFTQAQYEEILKILNRKMSIQPITNLTRADHLYLQLCLLEHSRNKSWNFLSKNMSIESIPIWQVFFLVFWVSSNQEWVIDMMKMVTWHQIF